MNWNEITSFFDVPKDRNNFITEHLSKEIQNLFLQIFKRASYCSEEKMSGPSNNNRLVTSYEGKLKICMSSTHFFARYINIYSGLLFINMENTSFVKFDILSYSNIRF